eukprot:11167866-Lingulodinium_polyedra.AAC.1
MLGLTAGATRPSGRRKCTPCARGASGGAGREAQHGEAHIRRRTGPREAANRSELLRRRFMAHTGQTPAYRSNT